MADRRDRDSVFNEPQFQGTPARLDPSEKKAERSLPDAKRDYQDLIERGHGVHEEPNILVARAGEVIDQDWLCSNCGYNLRGLAVGHRCPECAHIELYRPPPVDAESYGTWLRRGWARTPPGRGWWIAVLAIALGGPFSIFGAMLDGFSHQLALGAALVMVTVFGPAAEEVLKVAAASLIVELRPYWFRKSEQIQLAAIGTAAAFAIIENVIYLTVYFPNPSSELIVWRWTVCVALHVGCTAIAARGLVEIWTKSIAQFRQPRIGDGYQALVTAIVIHGLYNATVTICESLFF
jgi:hypothetical protein